MMKTCSRPRCTVRLLHTAGLLSLLCAACGGGGGGTPTKPSGSHQVALQANTTLTPWASGSLQFTISPALASSESLTCRIDGQPESPCSTGPTAGSLVYTSLAPGEHKLVVTIRNSSGSATTYSLPWQIASPDIVVFGGTPAGITAALAAARRGKTVVLLEPTARLGGMMTGGLAKSDVSGGVGIGGIALEFFDRTRDREKATGACPTSSSCPTYFDFEPKIAESVLEDMLAEQASISVQRGVTITAATKQQARLVSVETPRGRIQAKYFVDASYEGDLTAMAGVTTTMAREARITADASSPAYALQEDDAGVGPLVPPYGLAIDPYVVPGDASSGLLPFVQPKPASPPPVGSADRLIMAYNYRLCVTDDPSNRVAFAKPEKYDPSRYEGAARVAQAMAADGRIPLDELYFNPARTVRSADDQYFKYDLNGGSVFSTDMSLPEWNQAYPEATAAKRSEIADAYRGYMQGLLYFWQTDPRFGALNAKVSSFGLCKDEFTDNDHWPYRLYARETRRMVGEYVMNQNDVLENGRRPALADSVGTAGYSMDSHIRQITVDTRSVSGGPVRDVVVSEGYRAVRLSASKPYPVSYLSLTPRRSEAENLLNPITLSATSMAYSSLRMEPTFMILGQAAGTAAAMSVDTGGAVQLLSAKDLQSALLAAGQILK